MAVIDAGGCTTTLQFLDRAGSALGQKILNFKVLYIVITRGNVLVIHFINISKFRGQCPHSFRELQTVLRRAALSLQEEGKKFEYEIKD